VTGRLGEFLKVAKTKPRRLNLNIKSSDFQQGDWKIGRIFKSGQNQAKKAEFEY
jgi:hypothetical protein